MTSSFIYYLSTFNTHPPPQVKVITHYQLSHDTQISHKVALRPERERALRPERERVLRPERARTNRKESPRDAPPAPVSWSNNTGQ